MQNGSEIGYYQGETGFESGVQHLLPEPAGARKLNAVADPGLRL
jgi:hypothetical protein